MEFGINIRFFSRRLGMEKTARMVAEAGFTMLDYTPPVAEDDWKRTMQEDLTIFQDQGLTVHQTHAPFNRYNHHGDRHGLLVSRTAEATALMGAKYMVVHGDEFNFAEREFSEEAALAYNHQMFLPQVELGAQSGFQVAFETVFEDLNRRRFTSRAEELLALIESYGPGRAVCCWDTGHGHVAFRKTAPEKLRMLGPLIRCTHVHDNAGNDSHQMPTTGDIDWQQTVGALKEVGYSGVMSIEYAHGQVPEHMVRSFLELTYQSAEHIWQL